MKKIKRSNQILSSLVSLGVLTGVFLLVYEKLLSEPLTQVPLAFSLIFSIMAAGFWLRGQKKLKIAKLITENPIFRIPAAVISEVHGKSRRQAETQSCEIVVSYFGILLGSKIIKFNQEGIWLQAVEIGEDYLSFTCGTEKRIQNIRLLRPSIDGAELAKLAERLRYETGVTPTFLPREAGIKALSKNPETVC